MNPDGTLTIKEAISRKSRVYKDFVQFPYRLYKDSPYWVAPIRAEEKKFLDKNCNPFLKRNTAVYYVCYRGEKAVGRIAGIINKEHNQYHKDRAAFFGFFEAIDDEDVAELLFQSVTRWVKERGADSLRGPTNFTLNDVSGMLLEGFHESPFIMMPYNPEYYEKLYRKNGFHVAMRFFAYDVTRDTIKFPGFIDKLGQRLEDNDIIIRYFNFKELDKDFERIVGIFNEAWHENWGFTPLSYEEAAADFRKVKIFAKNDLLMIAECNGEPVGFAIALPDINQVIRPFKGRLLPFNWLKLFLGQKKITQIRVLLMGVVKSFRNKGIDLMFYKKIVDNSMRHGYSRAELSWILENNAMMNRVLQHINARRNKVYAIFEKNLE